MKLFKKKTKALYAMANGKSVAIEDVKDEVFSSKMMGEGIAILPSDGHIYAPCSGEVSMIMEHSLHALGIVSEDGMEVLLHIGLDSVELMGEGFQMHVKKHDIISTGDLLVSFDKALLKEKGISDITMLVIVEASGHKPVCFHSDEQVIAGSSILLEYN